MIATRVFPTLLYRDKGLYKGVRFKDHRYVGDVLNAIRIYNLQKVDELCVLDIGATEAGRCISPELVEHISSECMMPLSVGGGVSSLAQARELLTAGAEKLILCSHAVDNPNLVRDIAETSGAQSVVVSIDTRRTPDGYRVFTHNGTRETRHSPVALAREMQAAGAGEILINSIDRDGTQEGYDTDLIRDVVRAVDTPIIALGGAWTLQHMREAVEAGASAVTAGSMFVFFGRRRAVLVHFPDQRELREALAGDDRRAAPAGRP